MGSVFCFPAAKELDSMSPESEPWHLVKKSSLHGTGVFARRDIPAGTRIIDYQGKRITPEKADELHPVNPDDPFHTFFFSLSSGRVIDGGQRGNDARWINHSCAPNCETQENAAGSRVFIVALRDIEAGEELFYDYGLIIDGAITKTLRRQYACLCGAESCRGTMLALPKKAAGKKKDGDKKGAGKKDKKSSGKEKSSAKEEPAAKSADKADKKQKDKAEKKPGAKSEKPKRDARAKKAKKAKKPKRAD